MPFEAGKLRERVTIQRPTAAAGGDAWGAHAKGLAWEDEATVWADVRDLKAGEQNQGGTVQATVTHRVEIRYRAGITTRKRLIHNERILDIVSVVDLNQRREKLVIDCAQHIDHTTDEGA